MRMGKISLEKVGPGNISECGVGCLTGAKNLGIRPKVAWLGQRFGEGLRFFLFRDDQGKPLAFLEYVPGECAWLGGRLMQRGGCSCTVCGSTRGDRR